MSPNQQPLPDDVRQRIDDLRAHDHAVRAGKTYRRPTHVPKWVMVLVPGLLGAALAGIGWLIVILMSQQAQLVSLQTRMDKIEKAREELRADQIGIARFNDFMATNEREHRQLFELLQSHQRDTNGVIIYRPLPPAGRKK